MRVLTAIFLLVISVFFLGAAFPQLPPLAPFPSSHDFREPVLINEVPASIPLVKIRVMARIEGLVASERAVAISA